MALIRLRCHWLHAEVEISDYSCIRLGPDVCRSCMKCLRKTTWALELICHMYCCILIVTAVDENRPSTSKEHLLEMMTLLHILY